MTRRATSRSCPWSRRDLASASCTACSSSPERYHVAALPLNVKQSREIGIAVKKGFLPSTITQLFLQHVVDYTKDMGEITVIRH